MSQPKARKKQVTTVILAAGQSKRMGEAKLLLPWGAHTILDTTINHIKASSADDILLVSGGYREQVEAIAAAHQLKFTHNPVFATGEMLSSLQTAVRVVQASQKISDGILVMLGDLPFVETTIIDQVIQAFRETDNALIVAPQHNGRRGHPVLLSSKLFNPLLGLSHENGEAPRDLFQRYKLETLLIEVDTDTILRDIDTPEAYERERVHNSISASSP